MKAEQKTPSYASSVFVTLKGLERRIILSGGF